MRERDRKRDCAYACELEKTRKSACESLGERERQW